jgi:hypothetical protein
MPDGCVAIRFKMLTYLRVRSAFETNRALPSNIIWDFKANSKSLKNRGEDYAEEVRVENLGFKIDL